MKKIIQLLTSVLTIIPVASNVISCSNKNKNYDTFLEYTKDTENNYLIMVDGADGQDSKDMHENLWDPISLNPDENVSPLYQQSDTSVSWNSYILKNVPSIKNTLKDANVKFKNLEGQVQSKLWNESWSQNILKWCAQQSWNIWNTSDSDLKNQIYIDSYVKTFEVQKPIFIYLKNGKYNGIYTYDTLNFSKTSSNDSAITFYKWGYSMFLNPLFFGGQDTGDYTS